MEADWELEIGGGAPVIDAHWSGFVDLRQSPQRVTDLAELADLPALGETLTRLNASSSPVWTSKCDIWLEEAFDPDELDAPLEAAAFGLACYIDLLPAGDRRWLTEHSGVEWCKRVCIEIRLGPLRCSRVDLIVRSAIIDPDRQDFGVTAYVTACGSTRSDAVVSLSSALEALAGAVLRADSPQRRLQSYNEIIVGE